MKEREELHDSEELEELNENDGQKLKIKMQDMKKC